MSTLRETSGIQGHLICGFLSLIYTSCHAISVISTSFMNLRLYSGGQEITSNINLVSPLKVYLHHSCWSWNVGLISWLVSNKLHIYMHSDMYFIIHFIHSNIWNLSHAKVIYKICSNVHCLWWYLLYISHTYRLVVVYITFICDS